MYEVYCKAGTVELTKEEAFGIYNAKKYVVNSTAIYQPHYSQAQDAVYFTKIASVKGLAPRGRFYMLTAAAINNIVGYAYLAEL